MRKMILCCLSGILILSACQNQPQAPLTNTDSVPSKNTSLTVNHPQKFDSLFLRGLEQCNVGHIRITDSMMICQTSDTVFFPFFHKYNNLKYTGKEGVTLFIKWLNYNAVLAQITCKDQNGLIQNFSGKASLAPCFFFGSESFDIESDPGRTIMGTQFMSVDSQTNISVIIDDEDWKYCKLKFKSPDGTIKDLILTKAN
jgi:hypothetical protein